MNAISHLNLNIPFEKKSASNAFSHPRRALFCNYRSFKAKSKRCLAPFSVVCGGYSLNSLKHTREVRGIVKAYLEGNIQN